MINQFRERASRINQSRAGLDQQILELLTGRGEAYGTELLDALGLPRTHYGSLRSRLTTLERHGVLTSRYVAAAELDIIARKSGLGRRYYRIADLSLALARHGGERELQSLVGAGADRAHATTARIGSPGGRGVGSLRRVSARAGRVSA